MSDIPAATGGYDELATYEIRIRGHLDDRWAGRFEGLSLTREDAGVTLLAGTIADQAALHGVLRTVRDLGLPLLSVTQVPAKTAKNTTPFNKER